MTLWLFEVLILTIVFFPIVFFIYWLFFWIRERLHD